MNLGNMEKTGKLKKYRASSTGIQKLLKAAQRRLEDAKNSTAYNETRFEQAYETILICSKVAIQASGYRVRQREGHHYESIKTFLYTLNLDPKIVNYYQSVRRKRHKGLYQGFIGISKKELGDATDAADKLIQETKAWLKKNHPLLLRKAKPKESSR